MIERTIFQPEHEDFRRAFRKFCEREVAPNHARWEEQGFVDRSLWTLAGRNGYLCMTTPDMYGGAGADRLYAVVMLEELARGGFTGVGWALHSEIVAPYLLEYGTEEQRQRFLPRLVSGESIAAIAMTEPAAGSDLQGIQTTATRQGDGTYLLRGSKTFITNGWHADLVIVVAKTSEGDRARGSTLLLVERGMPGFEKGQRLKKLGMRAQDTCELFFDNVLIPPENALGGPAQHNRGFICLMEQLPWERLQIAITAVAASQAALDWTIAYVKERKLFGQSLSSYQNTRFTLVELHTEVQIARVFVDKCTELLLEGRLDTATASMAKYWATDLQCKVMDSCVQLHGGYGYMWDYPIARAYADARVQRIYGGTNEVMKEVIRWEIGLGGK